MKVLAIFIRIISLIKVIFVSQMKTRRKMTFYLCLAISALMMGEAQATAPKDSIAFMNATWKEIPLQKNAKAYYAQMEIFNSTQSISIVKYRTRRFKTEIAQLEKGESSTVSEFGRNFGTTFALNGSYFNMKTFHPVTFTYTDGEVHGRTSAKELSRSNGVLAIKGRKIEIMPCDTSSYMEIARTHESVLASGPVLVDDSKVVKYDIRNDGFYDKRHPRTFIGYSKGFTYLVVIDGRFDGNGEGTTIEETAYIAYLLGLEDAINLDGGGSSTLWTDRTGVLNHPSDNKKFDHLGERKIPNFISVK